MCEKTKKKRKSKNHIFLQFDGKKFVGIGLQKAFSN
jgi:hypothetical protein